MTTFAIDLLVLMILGFFIWSGYRKGLILSALTLVILFVSVSIGGNVASQNVEKAAGFFDELLSWVADEATEDAINDLQLSRSNMTINQLEEVSETAFISLGIHPDAAPYLAEVTTNRYTELSGTLYEAVSHVFIRAITWVALFAVGFLIANLIFSLIVNFLYNMIQLPPLRYFDAIGGILIGLTTGIVTMFVIGMGLRYAGIIIPDGMLEETFFLQRFIDSTPFGGLIILQ